MLAEPSDKSLPTSPSGMTLTPGVLVEPFEVTAMRRAVVGVLGGVLLLLGACGGSADNASRGRTTPTTQRHGEPVLISDRLVIAAEAGAEPISTGKVLDGSIIGGSPFCVGGTIRDSHASSDPAMKDYLIDRTITCPNGTVRIGLTPKVPPQGPTQTGSWTIVSGSGVFDSLRGSGDTKVKYDADPNAPAHETLTG